MTVRFDDQGTEFTVDCEPGWLQLTVVSPGSPAGGSSSESQIVVQGGDLYRLAVELGVVADRWASYVRTLDGSGWRYLWLAAARHATDSYTWFETEFDTDVDTDVDTDRDAGAVTSTDA